MEEKPLYGGLTVYRERGAFLRRLEQFGKSKHSYDEAYRFNPDDVRTLIGRSQVCSDLLEPRQAYDDAELALKLEPQNMMAKTTQARAMFTLCEFEKSLMMNHRGAKLRKQPPYFTDGIIQGLETMQDCIGDNAGQVMMEFLPIIRSMHNNFAGDLEPVQRQHVSRIPKVESKKRLTRSEARRNEILSRVMSMKYLGPMAYDKFYLQSLMEDPRLKSANSPESKELKNIVQEALNKLDNQQNILRTQCPYYTIKRAEKTESTRLTKFKDDTLLSERKYGATYVEKVLVDLQKCVNERKVTDLVSKAERLQRFLDSRTPRNLPCIHSYTNRLYVIVGEGYLCQYRVSTKISEVSNRKRVLFLLGVPIGRVRSHDSVIANYPYRFAETPMEIQKKKKQMEICDNPYMMCWLNFELARYELAKKNYALANHYATKCQRDADAIKPVNSVVWWLNACFVLMSSEMQLHHTQELKVHILEALRRCKEGHSHFIIDHVKTFLKKCLQVASDPGSRLSPERAAQMQREKDIIGVMDERHKIDATVLFKRMSILPTGRRFSVLPKMQEALKMTSERRKLRQRGLSIIPGK